MDLYDFCNTFVTAVAADATMEAWAQANFGKSVEVYAANIPDDPTTMQTPYVVFHSPSKSNHQERAQIDYGLDLWAVIEESDFKTRSEGNVTEPSGLELACDFATHLQRIIKTNLPSNTVCGFQVLSDTLGMLPELHMHVLCEFQQHLTIGSDPLG